VQTKGDYHARRLPSRDSSYKISNLCTKIKRNTSGRGYRYKQQADEKAVERRGNVSQTPKKLTPTLVAIIEECQMNT
jgi:hypothetical protein